MVYVALAYILAGNQQFRRTHVHYLVKRATAMHQRRLQQLCCDRRDSRRSVEDVLRLLGHCIRLSV